MESLKGMELKEKLNSLFEQGGIKQKGRKNTKKTKYLPPESMDGKRAEQVARHITYLVLNNLTNQQKSNGQIAPVEIQLSSVDGKILLINSNNRASSKKLYDSIRKDHDGTLYNYIFSGILNQNDDNFIDKDILRVRRYKNKLHQALDGKRLWQQRMKDHLPLVERHLQDIIGVAKQSQDNISIPNDIIENDNFNNSTHSSSKAFVELDNNEPDDKKNLFGAPNRNNVNEDIKFPEENTHNYIDIQDQSHEQNIKSPKGDMHNHLPIYDSSQIQNNLAIPNENTINDYCKAQIFLQALKNPVGVFDLDKMEEIEKNKKIIRENKELSPRIFVVLDEEKNNIKNEHAERVKSRFRDFYLSEFENELSTEPVGPKMPCLGCYAYHRANYPHIMSAKEIVGKYFEGASPIQTNEEHEEAIKILEDHPPYESISQNGYIRNSDYPDSDTDDEGHKLKNQPINYDPQNQKLTWLFGGKEYINSKKNVNENSFRSREKSIGRKSSRTRSRTREKSNVRKQKDKKDNDK